MVFCSDWSSHPWLEGFSQDIVDPPHERSSKGRKNNTWVVVTEYASLGFSLLTVAFYNPIELPIEGRPKLEWRLRESGRPG
jgi:hypothetical protein